MQIGSTVTLLFTGKLEDGTVFGYATPEEPMVFQTGMDLAIDGFESAVLEMNEVGEKKTFTVSQYDAYGEYLDDFTTVIPAEQLPKRNVQVGQRIRMFSDEGEPAIATVLEATPNEVKLDMNHPLAGHDLTFEVEILKIEDAPENFISAREKAEHMKEQAKLLGGDQGESYR